MIGALVQIIRRRFAERQITGVEIVGGIASRNESNNFGDGGSWRVAFVPPEDDGTFIPPVHIGEGDANEDGEAKRELHSMKFPIDVCCAARDADCPDDDLMHRDRCIDLWETVSQEIHLACAGNYELQKFGFDTKRKLGRFGAELVARVVFRAPIYDAPSVVATPTGAVGETGLGTIEETP